MINFSAISNRSMIGRALRLPLRAIPKGVRLPILQGPLRGTWWIAGSSTNGALLGTYELDTQRHLVSLLRPGDVMYDIGAHVGFHTLLASALVGPRGRVVAFEPDSRNVRVLRRHLAINGATNVTVVEAAVSSVTGSARFATNDNTQIGHLDAGGDADVRVVALDDIVTAEGLPQPAVIKMDVEGAESHALLGARGVLAAARPTLLFAVHARDTGEGWRVLEELGYQWESVDEAAGDFIARPTATRPPS